MVKRGMARPNSSRTKPRNTFPPIPKIQGKVESDKPVAFPMVYDTDNPNRKASHTEKPISKAYSVIDNDLARDNMENDLSDADLQDL